MLDFIVMQMSRVNREKGYCLIRSVKTKSAINNCTLFYYIVTVIVDGQFVAYSLKVYIYNCRKDEELVRSLRSYDKQISIYAMKKIRAPLLGLAKYIY